MLTIRDYQEAISKLTDNQKEILKSLYHNAPFLDSNEIAAALKFKSFSAANLHIGTIGKSIARHLNLKVAETYSHRTGERPSYFKIVHDFFEEGWDLQKNIRKAIRIELLDNTDEDFHHLPTEISSKENHYFSDGKAIYSLVNRYERDRRARQMCLEIKGRVCQGCGFDFKKEYGDDMSDNLIHVHHIKPLHEIKKEEEKNIIDDLIPLCPNCHAVVHSVNPMMSVLQLKQRRANKKLT